MSDAPEDDLILPLYILYTLVWMTVCLLTLPLVIVRQLVRKRFGVKAATAVVMMTTIICLTAWAVYRTSPSSVSATKPGKEWYMVTGSFVDISRPKGGGPKLVWYQYVDPANHKAYYLTLDYRKGVNHPRTIKGWVSHEHNYFYVIDPEAASKKEHDPSRMIIALILGATLGWYVGTFIDMMISQIDENITLHKAKFAT